MSTRSSLVVGFKDLPSSGPALAWSLTKAGRTGLDVVAVHVTSVRRGGSHRSTAFEAWFASEAHRVARAQVEDVRAATGADAPVSFRSMYGPLVECLSLASMTAVAVVIGDPGGRLRDLPSLLARECPACVVARIGGEDKGHPTDAFHWSKQGESTWPASHVS